MEEIKNQELTKEQLYQKCKEYEQTLQNVTMEAQKRLTEAGNAIKELQSVHYWVPNFLKIVELAETFEVYNRKDIVKIAIESIGNVITPKEDSETEEETVSENV